MTLPDQDQDQNAAPQGPADPDPRLLDPAALDKSATEPSPAPAARPYDPLATGREPLHFVVIVLLVADIVFGLGLAVFAEKVIAFRPMAIMGCGLAALGLGILAYFVLIGGGSDKARP
jgi:hypothetical protein